jgi:hypothetical protein
MKISSGFLEKPVQEWKSDDYVNAKNIVDNIRVVNDSAERGVKLVNDCIKSAKKEDRFQQILQVVENSRHCLPDQRKRKMEITSWYMYLTL